MMILFNRVKPKDVTRISFTKGMGEDERVFTNGVYLTQEYPLIAFWSRKRRYNLSKMADTLQKKLIADEISYPSKVQPYTWDFTGNAPLDYTPLIYMITIYEWNGERGRLSNVSVYRVKDLERYEVIQSQGDPRFSWHWNSWWIPMSRVEDTINEVFYPN